MCLPLVTVNAIIYMYMYLIAQEPQSEIALSCIAPKGVSLHKYICICACANEVNLNTAVYHDERCR